MKFKNIFYTAILLVFLTVESFAEITYLQILKDPTDLRLNLQYAKEQEAKGKFPSPSSTLFKVRLLIKLK